MLTYCINRHWGLILPMMGCYARKMYKKSILLNYCFYIVRFFGVIYWFNLLFGRYLCFILLMEDMAVIYGKKNHAFNKPFLEKEYELSIFITSRIITIKF